MVSKAKLRERFQAKKAKASEQAQQNTEAERAAKRAAKQARAEEAETRRIAAELQRNAEQAATMAAHNARAEEAQAKHLAEMESIEFDSRLAYQCAASQVERAAVLIKKEERFAEARASLRKTLRSIARDILDNPGKAGRKPNDGNPYPYLTQRQMQTRFRREVACSAIVESVSTSPTYERTERGAIRQSRAGG